MADSKIDGYLEVAGVLATTGIVAGDVSGTFAAVIENGFKLYAVIATAWALVSATGITQTA